MATQDIGELSFSDEDVADVVWGKLLPMALNFSPIDLIKKTYSFGRGEVCDYCFSNSELKRHPTFVAYSKIHFVVTKEETSTGSHALIEDLSSNGTFVNGIKIGKNNKQVLNHNDEISLITKRNKAFVYMDQSCDENKKISPEIIEKYTVSRVLGRGACGEVRLAFTKGTCQPFAIKMVNKRIFTIAGNRKMDLGKCAVREAEILVSLEHPCIVHVEDVIDAADTVYVVMEYVKGGELFDRVTRIEHFDEPVAKLLFYQMVSAVKYLHDHGITHRDLKPENILLMSERNDTLIKVSDFGLSKFVDGNTMLKTFCGTPTYVAPEILKTAGESSYTNAVDCWSLGVILYIWYLGHLSLDSVHVCIHWEPSLVGYPPFSDEYILPLKEQIMKGKYSFPTEYWKDISSHAIDLIKKLLNVDPEKRIRLGEVLEHPWLQDQDMIMKAHELMYVSHNESNLSFKRPLDHDDEINGNNTNSCLNNQKQVKFPKSTALPHQFSSDSSDL